MYTLTFSKVSSLSTRLIAILMHLLLEFNSTTLRSNYTRGEFLLLLIFLRWFDWLLDDVQRWHTKFDRHFHFVFSWSNYHLILFYVVVELYFVKILFILCPNLASCKYTCLMLSPFDSLRIRSCLLFPKLKSFHKRIVAYLYFTNLIINVNRRSR